MANIDRAYLIINSQISLTDWIGIILFGLLIFISFLAYDRKKYGKILIREPILKALSCMYLAFILCITLIGRVKTEEARAKLIPLWSWYDVIKNHNLVTFEELIYNIMLFIPLGVLLYLLMQITLKQVLILGLGLSCTIEILQYITHRGLFEWDDMLHNAFGCMVGYWFARNICRWIKNRSKMAE